MIHDDDTQHVVYHHRGSYLMSLGTITALSMPMHPTYMWIVPMFHCNGWGNPYTLTALAGTSICMRYVSAKNMFDAIADHKVTHFGGAPIVLNFLAQAKDDERRDIAHTVNVVTAGAPPWRSSSSYNINCMSNISSFIIFCLC